jgi:catechol-2,3-dioxygenase
MNKYDIEHIGICVEKPVEMANWYRDVLGFNIKFCAEDEEKGGAFLTDGSDKVMLELGKIPDVLPLAGRLNHHLQLHIALKSEDPDRDAQYLVSKGATIHRKMPYQAAWRELDSLERPLGGTPYNW